ncbi:hypothetical protein MMC26_006848 [Xylographa opegraphella]|nr:hypothetical protein [Xylographa opegraphella]
MKALPTVDRGGLDFSLTAFVVDHRARDGSTDEASLVAERLRRLGIQSRVLKLSWPQELNPSNIANFESEARRLRYPLLGHACHEQSIESLLSAHHADDQAETVLVRLSMHHKTVGLQGMSESADIPECWGIHGLCRSGGNGHKNARNMYISSGAAGKPRSDAKCIPFECGGISLYRPLLSFAKERLIATCVAGGIEWVEDKTNQDPTLTARNTVRQLLTKGRLPFALQKPSLLELAISAQSRVGDLEKSVERLRRASDILSFDNRVGSLVVRLSGEISSSDLAESYTHEKLRKGEIEHLSSVSILLRGFLELVSPLETVRLQRLQAATTAICTSKNMSLGLTVGGVRIQRSELAASGSITVSQQLNSPPSSEDDSPYSRRDLSGNQSVWKLSRQPYRSNTLPPTLLVPKQTATKNFVLWDGRFWIQLQNDTPWDICVRPLCPSDLAGQLTQKLARADWAELHEAAPGSIRWTIPVIAFADDVVLPPGVRRLIALPSLNLTFERHSSLINWSIRYKKVDSKLDRKFEVVEKLEQNDTIPGDMLVTTLGTGMTDTVLSS